MSSVENSPQNNSPPSPAMEKGPGDEVEVRKGPGDEVSSGDGVRLSSEFGGKTVAKCFVDRI